jgi:NAD(P)-dependent dehydrogenase (short-subunit alcohol dehydrogenase family)
MQDQPNFRLDGKTALITGSGRGIGLGIARALASVGCAVALADVDLDVARQEAARIEAQGGKAIAIRGDITQITSAKEMVDATVAQLGRLDILVNNAAIQSTVHWTEQSAEEIEAQYRANIVVPILLCQQAVKHFKPQKWGRILNIGSIQQIKGNPKMLGYSLTKSALHTMTRALARDLAPDRITVNLICPGYFDTWRNRFDWKSKAEMEQKGKDYVPLGWIGRPEDCGGAAVLLCSDAGQYITGQTLFVDGGLSVK